MADVCKYYAMVAVAVGAIVLSSQQADAQWVMHVVLLAIAKSCSECVTHLVSPIKIIFTVPILRRKETAHIQSVSVSEL